MLRPDQYYAILSIMRYGSLVLAMLFAGKIVALCSRAASLTSTRLTRAFRAIHGDHESPINRSATLSPCNNGWFLKKFLSEQKYWPFLPVRASACIESMQSSGAWMF